MSSHPEEESTTDQDTALGMMKEANATLDRAQHKLFHAYTLLTVASIMMILALYATNVSHGWRLEALRAYRDASSELRLATALTASWDGCP